MKKLISLLLLSFPLVALAGNDRLLGTWKSNKEATVAYLRLHTLLTSEQLNKVAGILGKMTISIDRTNMTCRLDDWKFVSPYKIISETGKLMTIEAKDPETGKFTRSVFEFEGNSFWTSDEKIRIRGFKERFDKIGQK